MHTVPAIFRCSEPGHRATVAIAASRGPGRCAWVGSLSSAPSSPMDQSSKDQITVLMSAASTIRSFEILRGADFTQQQFNCYADDYDGKHDRKTLEFAYKSLRVRPLAPKQSRFLCLFRRPKPQSRCLADEIEDFTRQRLSKPEIVEMYRKILLERIEPLFRRHGL